MKKSAKTKAIAAAFAMAAMTSLTACTSNDDSSSVIQTVYGPPPITDEKPANKELEETTISLEQDVSTDSSIINDSEVVL